MLGKIARFIRPAPTVAPLRPPLVSQVIDVVGGNIDQADNFESRLLPAIESACDYFDRQIATIPGPIDLSAKPFGEDASVCAIFPEAMDVVRALGRSVEVKESLPGLARSGHQHIHALLGMRSKPGSGSDDHSPILVDHTIRSLAPKEADTRDYLRLVAFNRLVKNFAEHTDKLRRKERLLKLEWNIQNEMAGNGESQEFVYAAKELTPENLLKGLSAWLKSPAEHFRIEPLGMSLRSQGGDAAPLALSDLPLLRSCDRRQWLVCFVRFSAEDGMRALSQETHTHRYIFI